MTGPADHLRGMGLTRARRPLAEAKMTGPAGRLQGIWVTRRPLVEARVTGPADLLRGMGVTRTKRPWVAGDEDEDPLGRYSHGSVDAAVICLCDYMHIYLHTRSLSGLFAIPKTFCRAVFVSSSHVE